MLNTNSLVGGGVSLEHINALNNNIIAVYKEVNFIKTLLLKNSNINNIFDTIYETNAWGNGSGSGSKESLNVEYVSFLQDFFKKFNIKTISDVGCGDWQFSKNIDFSGISYTGYDVANFVITRNLKNFWAHNINFICYDGDFDKVKDADLLICKDVLQHLDNDKISHFIANLPRFKYALIANDLLDSPSLNAQINTGQYRPLDLRKEPFNLSCEPVFWIKRMPKEPDICVMLWQNNK